jgi:hypothetical protein
LLPRIDGVTDVRRQSLVFPPAGAQVSAPYKLIAVLDEGKSLPPTEKSVGVPDPPKSDRRRETMGISGGR